MKRQRLIISAGAVLVAILVIILFSGDLGIVTFHQTGKQIRELQTKLEQSDREIDSLRREIKRLKTDTAYIERIAREKYGMARPEEKVYRFVKEK